MPKDALTSSGPVMGLSAKAWNVTQFQKSSRFHSQLDQQVIRTLGI